MCGICGIVTTTPSHADPTPSVADVRWMSGLMQRRGPDDEGAWSDESCAFGFRRLSILDLSPSGHQPMVSACGNFVLVFNGEVYNFRELRRTLEAREGVRFRSTSDTEVVLEALARWGEDALPKFNGMFALACYDRRRRSLLLARDPLGIKPLYYLLHREGLAFGSQYDQLVGHPWCDRSAVQPDVLALYLRLGYIPAPYGLLAGTHQLGPGHWARFTPGQGLRVGRYYDFADVERGAPPLKGPEALEAVAEVARAAVERQTVSDVPVGAFLSGGVDSPLVAGAMQAASKTPVPAVSIGTTDPRFDETDVARAYAAALGVEHTVRVFDAAQVPSYVDEVAAAYGEPFADASAFLSLMLCGTARERVTVALSGDGGDEVFWGYPRFDRLLRARGYFHYPRPLRVALQSAARVAGRPWPPRGVRHASLGDWQLAGHSALNSSQLRQFCIEAPELPESFRAYQIDGVPGEEELARQLRRAEIDCHLPMILVKMDRASMYYGLEVRVPLLDLELMSLAARIPPSECLHDGVGKLPLRAALGRYVSSASIPVRKAGFDPPMAEWLRGPLRPQFEQLVLDRDPYPQGFFRRSALRRVYAEHLQGKDAWRLLWNVLALQLWADRHLAPARLGPGPRPPQVPARCT